MKKLPALLNTPARAVIAVGLIILTAEFIIMMLINGISPFIINKLPEDIRVLLDPIMLIVIASPALYILIFRPMRRQQNELERQVEELRRFQKLTVGRELRMKELVEENTALREKIAAAPADDTSS